MRKIKNKRIIGEIMKVETKYSIGDTVWIVRFNYDRNEYVPDARKIVQIAIYIKKA